MIVEVTIENITGATPFDVYICDNTLNNCIYISTITTTPFTFEIPEPFNVMSQYNLRIIDGNNCIIDKNFFV
jgi:hypothetical protein